MFQFILDLMCSGEVFQYSLLLNGSHLRAWVLSRGVEYSSMYVFLDIQIKLSVSLSASAINHSL